jgi:hypothetical protein
MSGDNDKFKHSRRLHDDQRVIDKQVKIAKAAGMSVDKPHKFAKHHAMDCGNPGCIVCGNPRKIFKEPTQQEKRLFQDIDKEHDRHSNGLKNKEEDNE